MFCDVLIIDSYAYPNVDRIYVYIFISLKLDPP